MPATSPRSTPIGDQPALSLRRRPTSATATRCAGCFARARDRRRHASGRRKPCRPLDRRPGGLHRDQHRRHLHAARGRAAATGRSSRGAARKRFRFHHISTDEVFGDLPVRRRQVHRGDALRAVLALFGLQGGVRPSGAGLARTPTACRSSLSNCSNNYGPYQFPEKLIPLDDPQRARGQADCRSTARARTCATGSMSRTMPRRSSPVARARPSSARPTMSAAMPSAPISTWSRRSATSSTSRRPLPAAARGAS